MAQLVDQTVLQTLKQLEVQTGNKIVHQMIEQYINKTKTDLNEMKTALEKQDYETLQNLAHTLKSSSGNVGAFYISECCFQMEDHIRHTDFENLDPNHLQHLVQEVTKALKKTFDELKSVSAFE